MREVHVKLLCFEIKLDISHIALPLALVTVPRWDSDPREFVLAHVCCAVSVGTATSCFSLLDSAIHKATVLSTQSQSTLSPELGGSAAGLSEFGDSDSQFLSELGDFRGSSELSCSGLQFLSSATQEDFRSSATPEDAVVETSHHSATM